MSNDSLLTHRYLLVIQNDLDGLVVVTDPVKAGGFLEVLLLLLRVPNGGDIVGGFQHLLGVGNGGED